MKVTKYKAKIVLHVLLLVRHRNSIPFTSEFEADRGVMVC